MAKIGKIVLAGSKNVRDLGGIAVEGGVVRDGLLLRGGNLFACTPRDAKILRDELGVSLVIDLRTATERSEKPDIRIEGVENVHLPLFTESVAGVTHEDATARLDELAKIIPVMTELYRRMVSDECRESLSLTMQAIMDSAIQGRTVLFHCTEGKDRTGLVAAILLTALGASRDQVMADDLFSRKASARKAQRYYWLVRLLRRDREAAEKLRAAFSISEEYLDSAFAAIDETWGSVDGFLVEGLGVSADRLCLFRQAATTISEG